MPGMLCLSWIRHLSNACSVFSGAAQWCCHHRRRAARQEGLGKSNEAAQGEEHERQELEKEFNERGFGICGGARCCREARRRQSAVFSLTYLAILLTRGGHLPTHQNRCFAHCRPLSGKDSERGVVKVQPWRLSPPLAIDSSYR